MALTVGDTSSQEMAIRVSMLELTGAGIEQSLRKLFSNLGTTMANGSKPTPITVFQSSDPDNPEKYLQAKGAVLGKLRYPIVSLTPTNLKPSGDSYNAQVLRRIGAILGRTSDGQTTFMFKMRPVAITYAITILTDDYVTLLAMADKWISNEIWNFYLRVEEVSKQISIQVSPDKELNLPARSTQENNTALYRLQTNITAQSYTGYLWRVPLITSTTVEAIVGGSIEDALDTASIPYLTKIVLGVGSINSNGEVGVVEPQSNLMGIDVPYPNIIFGG